MSLVTIEHYESMSITEMQELHANEVRLINEVDELATLCMQGSEDLSVLDKKLQEYVDSGRIKDTVDMAVLVENRLARRNDLVKILGRGELKASLNITVHKFTATAKAAIEAAGGSVTTL